MLGLGKNSFLTLMRKGQANLYYCIYFLKNYFKSLSKKSGFFLYYVYYLIGTAFITGFPSLTSTVKSTREALNFFLMASASFFRLHSRAL